MHRCQDQDEAAQLPHTPFKDPTSGRTLMEVIMLRTHWAAHCFRAAALITLLGAIFFDGLNFWSQLLNMVAIGAFAGAAVYVDGAASMLHRVLERERQLEKVSAVIGDPSAQDRFSSARSAQQELAQTWSCLEGEKVAPGASLPDVVKQLRAERDRAWKAVDDAHNGMAKAYEPRQRPNLRLISGHKA